MTSLQLVHFEVLQHTAHVQINRPESLNALNKQVLLEIDECCARLKAMTDVHVVIVSGAGEKAFVAGADIKEMQDFSCEQARVFSEVGAKAFWALESLPQIVVAKVQGFALGGGLELALACDIIISSQNAKFGFPEVTLGLIPGFSGTQRLARKIGASQALEWITTAQKFSALEAKAAGVVNHVVAHEELASFTENFVHKILANAPQAVKRAKHVIKQGLSSSFESGCALESAHFGLSFKAAESKEGILAFLEKRKPQFNS